MFLCYLRRNFARNTVRMDFVLMVKNVSLFMISVRLLLRRGPRLSNKLQEINFSFRVLMYLLKKTLFKSINLMLILHQSSLKRFQPLFNLLPVKFLQFQSQIQQWLALRTLYTFIRELAHLETKLQISLFKVKNQIFPNLWCTT